MNRFRTASIGDLKDLLLNLDADSNCSPTAAAVLRMQLKEAVEEMIRLREEKEGR